MTEDAVLQEQYTEKLYHHLYVQYEEKGEIEHMMDHSFMTEVEIMIEQHRNDMAKLRKELEEKDKQLNESREKANKQAAELQTENARLRALLQEREFSDQK